MYIKGQNGFIPCLHSLFISHVNAVNTKGNRYIKGGSGFIIISHKVCQCSWSKSSQTCINCNAFSAMYVDTVDTSVCDFHTTLYTEYNVHCIQDPLLLQERRLQYLKNLPSCGSSGSPVWEGSFVLAFWDLSNYKGSCS